MVFPLSELSVTVYLTLNAPCNLVILAVDLKSNLIIFSVKSGRLSIEFEDDLL